MGRSDREERMSDEIRGLDEYQARCTKTYLKRLVKENVEVGIEIIAKKEARQ